MLDSEDADNPEDEEPVEEELEAEKEVDKDQQTSNEQEIEELVGEVDTDSHFFVGVSDLELGQSAMTKVHSKFIGILMNWLHLDDKASKADLP